MPAEQEERFQHRATQTPLLRRVNKVGNRTSRDKVKLSRTPSLASVDSEDRTLAAPTLSLRYSVGTLEQYKGTRR